MRKIELTQGQVALVDAGDYLALNQFKWYYRNGYAARAVGPHGGQKFLLMQNIIMGVERGTDHIDRDKLNNTRSNLRVVSLSRQNSNRKFRERELPRGVYKQNNRYLASGPLNGKRIRLGLYDTPEEASIVYRDYMLNYTGEYPPE